MLPATTQFEKFESTFFNFEFPKNVFHLRRPVVAPPDGPLAEPEIHARILEAAGLVTAGGHRAVASGGASRAAPSSPRRSAPRSPPSRHSDRSRRCCCTARSARPCRTAPPRRPRSGRSPSGACSSTRGCRARRVRDRAGCSRPPVRRDRRQPVGRRDHRRRARRVVATVVHLRRARPPRHARTARRARRARRATRLRVTSGRSCCPPASAVPSPPTPSSATRRGASAPARTRCASPPSTPNGSASPTAIACGS